MNMSSSSRNFLTLGYWNIHGHRSRLIGDKLCDNEFLKIIEGVDIIELGEIQAGGDVCIPGYVCVKQKIREKKFKGPKIAGGLGVFIKKEIGQLVQLIPSDNQDSIWIKLKKELTNEKEDIYIGTFYVSPRKKTNNHTDFFKTTNEELIKIL